MPCGLIAHEIGQVAEDINKMAEGLRTVIVSRDDLAKEVLEREQANKLYKAARNQAQKYLDTVDVMIATLDSGECHAHQ